MSGLDLPLMERQGWVIPMLIVRAGVFYFGLVFAAGFVFGIIRVLWVIPILGASTAELIETPIMVTVSVGAAHWVIRRLSHPLTRAARLSFGFIALGFLLSAEFTFVLWVRGLSLREYVTSRDPVAGTAYILALGLFAVMPLLVARR